MFNMAPVMKTSLKLMPVLIAALLAAAATHAQADQQSAGRQDAGMLRIAAEHFLKVQTTGLPGKVDIAVTPADSRLNLAACAALEPFLPPGGRVWGKTTVGMRCNAPSAWTIYMQAHVRVTGDYFATAAPLKQGQSIGQQDLVKQQGDLTALPPGIITDPAQAVGRTLTMSLGAGIPLRLDALRAQQAVQQGQVVKVISAGPGFSVSAEARALAGGAEGQIVQARTASGQVISGVAKAGGVVEVTY